MAVRWVELRETTMDGVPVRWLVGRRDLGLTVLAGAAGLDTPATWAHSIELADPGPWLAGGELLLTTGLRLPADPAAQRRYVAGLVGAGVAALGFGTGLTYDPVPPALVQAAEAAGLPLVEVPLPTPFVAVTRALMERLAELRYEDAVRAARSQPRMTRAVLRGGPSAVVRELAVAAGGSVLLFGPDGALRTAYPTAAAGAAVGADLPAGHAAQSAVHSGPHGTAAAQPVQVGRRSHGRLVLLVERPLSATDHLLLGHAASLLALDAEKTPRLRAERHRLNGLLLGLLLDTDLPAAADLLAEAGLPAGPGLRLLALAPGPGGDPHTVLAAAGARAEAAGLPRFGAVRDGLAVLLLPGGEAAGEAGAERVRALAGGARAGLSGPHGPEGVRTAWQEARSAVAAAGDGGLVRHESLAGSALTAAPETRAVLLGLARARIGPLAAHDAAHGTELLPSLRAFLEHHGQWEAAAASLGVHRHTLRTRIDRARAVLGTDLDSAHVRAELLMALTVWPPGATGP
ncbi:PucR family transcriptional regulator [Kitasatospora paranensis]|uniref:PucR family transcriptional regulator n=1 Tax=Kitasatospora paranensis TaxID=258053 RepID=A0ABW2FLX9_9ACTN